MILNTSFTNKYRKDNEECNAVCDYCGDSIWVSVVGITNMYHGKSYSWNKMDKGICSYQTTDGHACVDCFEKEKL